jgi:hypothetical protein
MVDSWRPGEAKLASARPYPREVAPAVRKKTVFFFFYSNAWAQIASEIKMRVELYQTLFEIADARWSCSMVELAGSMDLELFFENCSSTKQALHMHLAGMGTSAASGHL